MDWTYGGFAKKYDMTAGKIEIGTGVVKVHDLMNPIPEWLRGDVVFCDPPCSQGNLQAFATKAGKGTLQTGEYNVFEKRLTEVFDEINPKIIYLEVFKANYDFWYEYLKSRYKSVSMAPSFYYNKPDNKCWIATACNWRYYWLTENFELMDEAKIIKQICQNMARLPLDSICDPCMGKGLVGFWANYYGVRFTGTELNPNRLAYLLERINQGRLTPKKSS